MANTVDLRSAMTLVLVLIVSALVTACHAKQQTATAGRCTPLNGISPNASMRPTTTTYIYADNQTVAKIIKNSTGSCVENLVE